MDEWDDHFLSLLDLICMFLGCGIANQADPEDAELEKQVESFIERARLARVPTGRTLEDLEFVLGAVEGARLINGSQAFVPAHLAAELDAVLGRIEDDIRTALAGLNEDHV